MNLRPIPRSGEMLPVIGCGTYLGFDAAPGSSEYRRLPDVLGQLFAEGGAVIDSSPMYGRAEETLGHLLRHHKRERAFLATKVWAHGRDAGVQQMRESMGLLRTDRIDLMQIHNLLEWRTHLPTLFDWKESGRIRYVGVSHCDTSGYAELEAIMRNELIDFIQINYSADRREAAERILPLAMERNIAVMVNMPFGSGRLLRRPKNQPLPPWAAETGAETWAQLLLKFVLSQPAVTCVIPGTGNPEHMQDNLRAGDGFIPEPSFWEEHRLDARAGL